jgi:hypothetical protein
MKIKLSLPEYGADADLHLYEEAAPHACRLLWEALAQPLHTRTSHACFAGRQVFLFLPKLLRRPPRENQTMRPEPGEVMLFCAGPSEFAFTRDERLGGSGGVFELALMYGEVDLRHWGDEGMQGTLVGRLGGPGVSAFAQACAETLDYGSTPITLARVEGHDAPTEI